MTWHHKLFVVLTLWLCSACTTSTAYLDYKTMGALTNSPQSSLRAEDLGQVSFEDRNFFWKDCKSMARKAMRSMLMQARVRGGNAIHNVRFVNKDGAEVLKPTCVNQWGWIAGYFTAVVYVLPFPQKIQARAVATRIPNWDGRDTTALTNPGSGMAPTGLYTSQLRNPGLKCASLPISALGISDDVAKLLDEVLLGELQGAGFEALGSDDINAMLGLEQLKDAVACDAASCMTEIGGALGVDYLITGKIGLLDSAKILTVKLIDVRQAKVLARANGQSSSEAGLTKVANKLVADLVRQSGL